MNLRILKKLSKRAAPIIAALGDRREQFRAEKHENFTGSFIHARKHWERGRTVWTEIPKSSRGRFCYRSRAGHVIQVSNDYIHPRKGTVMVGSVSGGEEPEWDEETAWDALSDWVHAHFTDWGAKDGPRPTRQIETPRDVFVAARDMLAELSTSTNR